MSFVRFVVNPFIDETLVDSRAPGAWRDGEEVPRFLSDRRARVMLSGGSTQEVGMARAQDGDRANCFLPEFCRLQTLFAVVVIAQLLVFVIVLVQPAGIDRWTALSLYSLFVQWVAIGSTLLLCLTRPFLCRLPMAQAGVIAWLLVLLVTLVVGEGARQALAGADPRPGWEFHARNLAISGIAAAVSLRYLHQQFAWRRRLETLTRARIEALQARIQPHFLFNSLNTILALIRQRPDAAEGAVEDLSGLFRASLADVSQLVPLAGELELARNYLRLEELRLGERLIVDWQVDALPDDALLPPMTLQPLLENAVRHGVEPCRRGGVVRLTGRRRDNRLQIDINNPLAPGPARYQGSGTAQNNVMERLQLAFGNAASFTAHADDETYAVHLAFPYRRSRHARTDC